MKTTLLSIAFIASSLMASAQMKPAAGTKTLEVNFTPLGGSPISINNIRLRSFSSETSALRLGIGITYMNDKTANGAKTADGKTTLFNTSTVMNINLRPGIEKHMAISDRVSPYMGAELDLAFQSTTDKAESDPAANNKVETATTTGTNGYTRFGLNALAGVDVHLVKGLYIGSELGFGLQYVGNSDVKQSSTVSGFTAPEPTKGGSSINFGPNVNAAIRLGWMF